MQPRGHAFEKSGASQLFTGESNRPTTQTLWHYFAQSLSIDGMDEDSKREAETSSLREL